VSASHRTSAPIAALLDRGQRAVEQVREARATCVELTARARALHDRLADLQSPAHASAWSASRVPDERPAAQGPDLAMLAHDLRSPLAAILNWTEVLRAASGSRVHVERAIEAMQSSGLEALKMLERLLDDVSPGGQRRMQRVQVADVTGRIVRSLAVFADQRGATITLTVAPDAPDLRVDPVLFGRVVRNLLENAIRHATEGGTIRVCVEPFGEHLRLTIDDDGAGIAPADLPYLFQPFWTRTGTSGAGVRRGLGLASVRHIIESLGGTVRADSPGVGRGATFTVTLPCTAEPS
jgi:signal transduction histidine kinase